MSTLGFVGAYLFTGAAFTLCWMLLELHSMRNNEAHRLARIKSGRKDIDSDDDSDDINWWEFAQGFTMFAALWPLFAAVNLILLFAKDQTLHHYLCELDIRTR